MILAMVACGGVLTCQSHCCPWPIFCDCELCHFATWGLVLALTTGKELQFQNGHTILSTHFTNDFNFSWMFLQGIETLPLRMERHCENTKKVAEFLKDHPKVEWIRYPGLKDDSQYEKNLKYLQGKGGSLVVFEMSGGADAGKNFIDSLELLSHVANVGDAKSLAIHPATTTHSQMNEQEQANCGITPGMVRLSIGLEHIDDILADIDHALSKV
jgi:O-acetylhomoserine/O-acetylserine sulfhydrylase-like pyridoxal-dependent enzyme